MRYPEHINWKSDTENDADALAEFGGRLCYLSFGEDAGIAGHKTIKGRSTNSEYLANILATGHGSVLEHNIFTVLIEGVSRALTHELVRHRHLSFSQLSQRYVDESDVSFVMPPEIRDSGLESPLVKDWIRTCFQSRRDYRRMLEHLMAKEVDQPRTIALKRARQAARSVLPNSTETKIVVSGNARAWRHFFNLRGNPHADREIRQLAVAVFRQICNYAPNIFQDIEIIVGPDGFEMLSMTHGSV